MRSDFSLNLHTVYGSTVRESIGKAYCIVLQVEGHFLLCC